MLADGETVDKVKIAEKAKIMAAKRTYQEHPEPLPFQRNVSNKVQKDSQSTVNQNVSPRAVLWGKSFGIIKKDGNSLWISMVNLNKHI